MKGMLFTGFLELVEKEFGLEMLDEMIEKSKVESGGIYTTVGNYPHSEMVQMLIQLQTLTGIPIKDLLFVFGKFMFGQLVSMHESLIKNISDPFDLLENIEDTIHVEVKKLYTDAKPPMFKTILRTEKELIITYHSPRKLGDVAEGLIMGCGEHYNTNLTVKQESLLDDGSSVKFYITKN